MFRSVSGRFWSVLDRFRTALHGLNTRFFSAVVVARSFSSIVAVVDVGRFRRDMFRFTSLSHGHTASMQLINIVIIMLEKSNQLIGRKQPD